MSDIEDYLSGDDDSVSVSSIETEELEIKKPALKKPVSNNNAELDIEEEDLDPDIDIEDDDDELVLDDDDEEVDDDDDDEEDLEEEDVGEDDYYDEQEGGATTKKTDKKTKKTEAATKTISNIKKTSQLPIIMDSDDDDDDTDENYLQKFDQEINKNYVKENHPECIIHNYEEVKVLTEVVRDSNNIIIDPFHKTIPFLTKYEKARILGQRAKQIESGAKPFVKVPENVIDGYIIAELELRQKRIPFILRRPLPSGGCEYWNLRDLEIIL
jgi:DNA-directed RNA polymerase I, II, and III subunit RPABC2